MLFDDPVELSQDCKPGKPWTHKPKESNPESKTWEEKTWEERNLEAIMRFRYYSRYNDDPLATLAKLKVKIDVKLWEKEEIQPNEIPEELREPGAINVKLKEIEKDGEFR